MRPPATTGEEWVSVPSSTDHWMFRPVWGSKDSGSPVSSETMLRDQAWPHCAWSAARAGRSKAPQASALNSRGQSKFRFIGCAGREKPKRFTGTRTSCGLSRDIRLLQGAELVAAEG